VTVSWVHHSFTVWVLLVFCCLLQQIKREVPSGEYINIGVGVIRDGKLKLEGLKASHTLGGGGQGDS